MSSLSPQLAEFSADWLKREPALALCHRFAAKPTHWLASVVLVEELLQAMFALSNHEVAQAKLAWWTDEADLAVSGAPRHPLTQALCAARSNVRALPDLTRAACLWITLPTASDSAQQRSQLAAFAAAASELIDESATAAIWTELALKRQLQNYAKPERYGPGVFSRAALAEFQLKASQIVEPTLASGAIAAQLNTIRLALQSALQPRGSRGQSATRSYALLQAREAGIWAKEAAALKVRFSATLPGLAGLLRAWWIARGRHAP